MLFILELIKRKILPVIMLNVRLRDVNEKENSVFYMSSAEIKNKLPVNINWRSSEKY